MLLICPCHTPEFLTEHALGVEGFITKHDVLPNWEQYIPFVKGIHLPYAKLNLAALDDELRTHSIETVKAAIDEGCKYPVYRMVMHSMGIKAKNGEVVGEYDRMIDGLRKLGDYAATKNITLCLENQALHIPNLDRFGTFADEWIQLIKDAKHPNLKLTLDTSHAACAAATFDTAEERFAYLFEFLKEPELIKRVHWSDSKLTNKEAYFCDMHLVPGEGDLPIEFHKQIKALDAIITLEQYASEERVIKGLQFIDSL